MKSVDLVTEGWRWTDTGVCWEEQLSNATGSIEAAKCSSVRVRATGNTTVSLDGVLAATMQAGEVAIFNTGDGNPDDNKQTVTVTIGSAPAYVQVAREVARVKKWSNGFAPLLQVLPSGPTTQQIATGVLYTSTGQPVSCVRASPAYCTKADGSLILLGNNQIRVEPNGILVEQPTTNLVLQSNSVGTTPWAGGGASPTMNATTAPDNTNTATLQVKPTTAQLQSFSQPITLSATTQYTCSFYVKAQTSTQCQFGLHDGTNFMSGATGRILSGPGTIQLCNNGVDDVNLMWIQGLSTTQWTRVSVTVSTNATTSQRIVIYPDTAHSTTANAGNYYWGFQVETGPFATSLIPTTTTTANRAGDVVTVANLALNKAPAWSTSFDILKEGFQASNADGMPLQMYANPNDRMEFYLWSNGATISEYAVGANSCQTVSNPGDVSLSKAHIAVVQNGTTLANYVNGVFKSSTSSTPVGPLGSNLYTIYIGSYDTGIDWWNGWISNICIDTDPAKCL